MKPLFKQSIDPAKSLIIVDEFGNPVQLTVESLANSIQSIILKQPIDESVSAQGVDGTTTTYLNYGVNVITSADANNYAIRLPYPPIKGRTVTIINNTSTPIVVHPSIVGGSINGVIDGTATIPADGVGYTFTCWENPLPGAWTWSPPAVNQLVSTIFSVSHTNGIATKAYGFTTQQSGVPQYSLITPPAYNIQLSGTSSSWFTIPNRPSVSTRLKVGTNIKAADVNGITIFVGAFIGEKLTNSTSSTAYQDFYSSFITSDGSSVTSPDAPWHVFGLNTAGGNNTPAKLGDIGTIFTNTDIVHYFATLGIARIGNQGFGSSQIYGTFVMEIPADAPTKTYEFQFFLEHT